MIRPQAAFRLSLLAVSLGLGVACGSENATGPQDDLDFLIGDWEADILLVRSREDPSLSVDLIESGASFRINVQPSGAYTATLTAGLTPFTEIGTLALDGNQLTFYRDFPTADTATGTLTQLSADRIRLLGETRFDLDSDGESEEADLESELVRQ